MKFKCDDEILVEFSEADLAAMFDAEDRETAFIRLKTKITKVLEAHRIQYRRKMAARMRGEASVAAQENPTDDRILRWANSKDYKDCQARKQPLKEASRAKGQARRKEVEKQKAEKDKLVKEQHAKHSAGKPTNS